jgi:hypothetical protein
MRQNTISATVQRELSSLRRKHRITKFRVWWHRRKSVFFDRSHQSALRRSATPIPSLLRTSIGLILSVSGIGGSALGFVVGHAILGVQGTLVTIPIFGAAAFFTVARFAFNGSLFDEPTLLQKSEEESAHAERWQAEADGLADLVTQTIHRLDELKREFAQKAAQTQAPTQTVYVPDSVASAAFSSIDETQKVQLIANRWQSLPATDKQIRYARQLGIPLTGRERRGDLCELTNQELQRRSKSRKTITRERYVGMRSAPNPGIAVLFNLFWPGIGQVYQGRAFFGLFLMIATPIGYFCCLAPGALLHLLAIFSAALYRPRLL